MFVCNKCDKENEALKKCSQCGNIYCEKCGKWEIINNESVCFNCRKKYINNINSILFEGTVYMDASMNEEKACVFKLASTRYYKKNENDNNLTIETTLLDVELPPNLTRLCTIHLTKDKGIRVVGRMKNENNKIFILAEHIELIINFEKGIRIFNEGDTK